MTKSSNLKTKEIANNTTLCPCPSCMRRISIKALKCPKCGDPLEDGWINESLKEEDQQKKGCLLWVVGIPATILIVTIMFSIKYPNNNVSTNKSDSPSPVYESELIRDEEYGDQWPFGRTKVANLVCFDQDFGGIRRPVAVIEFYEGIYGLNGVAMGVAGFKDFRTLLPRDQETGIYDLKASLEIGDRAIKLCGF